VILHAIKFVRGTEEVKPRSLEQVTFVNAKRPPTPVIDTSWAGQILDGLFAVRLDSASELNMGCERDEYPSGRRQRDPVAGGNRSGDDREWTREPPDRTATTAGDRRKAK
jgi:hypothetical protein